MKINIIPPHNYPFILLYQKTKKYMKGEYNKGKARDVFEGRGKKYYIFIKKKSIQIELISHDLETITEIEKYLTYLFNNRYIGITYDGIKNIQLNLKNIQCFNL